MSQFQPISSKSEPVQPLGSKILPKSRLFLSEGTTTARKQLFHASFRQAEPIYTPRPDWTTDKSKFILADESIELGIDCAQDATVYLGSTQSKAPDQKVSSSPFVAKDINQAVKEMTSNRNMEDITESTKKAEAVAQPVLQQPQPKITYLTQGKAKAIYTKSNDPKNVYFTSIGGIANSIIDIKKKEIQEEVQTANAIKSNLEKNSVELILSNNSVIKFAKKTVTERLFKIFNTLDGIMKALDASDPQSFAKIADININYAKELYNLKDKFKQINPGENLAIQMQEVGEAERIEGKYTVKAAIAEYGDMEKDLRDAKNDFDTKIALGKDILRGASDLHDSDNGFIHRDLKTDNVLIFKEQDKQGNIIKRAKLADFGKTQPCKDNEKQMRTGNPRFAPPEGRDSKQGEVYAVGILLIRLLEDDFLNQDTDMMLKELPNKNPDSKYRGIEKFLVFNEACPQTETLTLKGNIRLFNQRAKLFFLPQNVAQGDLKKAELDVHSYIDILTEKLKKEENPQKMDQLNGLLKEMTLSDPKARPTMQQALERYSSIMG